jgi:hypothetical protein
MFDPQRKHADVVDELRRWAALRVGDPIPTNGWGEPLTALFNEAIAEIERLRSLAGAVTRGPSLADIKAKLTPRV